MTERWKRRREEGNDGKLMTVWYRGDFEISQNIFDGKRWLYEVLRLQRGKWHHAGSAPTLAAAKLLAKKIAQRLTAGGRAIERAAE